MHSYNILNKDGLLQTFRLTVHIKLMGAPTTPLSLSQLSLISLCLSLSLTHILHLKLICMVTDLQVSRTKALGNPTHRLLSLSFPPLHVC